jgi:hypothetical protein
MIKSILAIDTAATKMPVKPNKAAIKARTKKVNTQDNMTCTPFCVVESDSDSYIPTF